MSTQTYLQENEPHGLLVQTARKIYFELADGTRLEFPCAPNSNLPLMLIEHIATLESSIGLNGTDAQGLLANNRAEDAIHLLHENNHNLSGPQKELMLWHYRLCHCGLGWVQDLMRHSMESVQILHLFQLGYLR